MNSRLSAIRPGTLILAALSVAVVLAPVLSDLRPALSLMIMELTLGAAIIAGLGYAFRTGMLTLPPSGIAWIAGLFLVFALISVLQSVYEPGSWRSLFLLLLAGGTVLLATLLSRLVPGFADAVRWTVLTSAVLQTLIGIHQCFFEGFYARYFYTFHQDYLIANSRGGVLRAVGTFQNANYFAALLCMAYILALVLALSGKRKLNARLAFAGIALVLLFGIFLSGSKMAFIVVALTTSLALIRIDWRFAGVLAAILVAGALVPNPVRDSVLRGIHSDATFGMRPALWNTAIEMTVERPFTGTGPGNYAYLSHLHMPPVEQEVARYGRVPGIAHNSFLHTAAETGLPAALCALAIFVLLLWKGWNIYAGRWRNAAYSPLQLGAALALAGICIHSLVDNTLNHPALLLTVALFVPVLLADRLVVAEFNPVGWGNRLVRGASVLLVVILAGIVLYGGSVVPGFYEWRLERARQAIAAGEAQLAAARSSDDPNRIQGVEALMRVEQDLQSLLPTYDGSLALHRYLGYLNSIFFNQTGQFVFYNRSMHHYRAADDALHNVSSVDVSYQYSVYRSLLERGYPPTEEAREKLDYFRTEMVARWPLRAAYYVRAASISLQLNDASKARYYLDRAIQIEPRYLQAYVLADRIGFLTGNRQYRQQMQRRFGEELNQVLQMELPGRDDRYTWNLLSVESQPDWDQTWLEQHEEALLRLSLK